MTWVNGHSHADQWTECKIFMCWFHILIAGVASSDHGNQRTDGPVFMWFHLNLLSFFISYIFLRNMQTGIYRLVPFLSKFFFNAISVGRIDPIKGISWTPQIIPPILPTQSSFFPITKSMNITVIGNITIPQTYQTLPQYLWANSHAKLQMNNYYGEIITEYLTNYMCFIVLSVEIFSILFTFGVVKSVVVLLFVDTAIFIGLLVVGLVKMDLRGKEVLWFKFYISEITIRYYFSHAYYENGGYEIEIGIYWRIKEPLLHGLLASM